MEYVYKLNLDPIEDIVKSVDDLSTFDLSKYDSRSPFGFITYPDPEETLKPEAREYLGFKWNRISLHYKGPRNRGTLHRDNWRDPNTFIWAVNWVWGESSTLEYWENDLISESKITPDGGGSNRVQGSTSHPPSKVYNTPPGVYLINASVYHRATNIGSNVRYAFSLRCVPNRYMSWNMAVNHFEKYFTGENLL